MKQINPTRPYHPRSPDYEAEIGGKDGNQWWGRAKSKASSYWCMANWDNSGICLGMDRGFDLIQEPKVEEIVWDDIKIIQVSRSIGYGYERDKVFSKPISLTITIQGDKVKIEGGH
jgi:hypothetical protein